MRVVIRVSACLLLLQISSAAFADDVLFADNFKDGLSSKWEIMGLEKTDYRIRDGGLEMRVQPGKVTNKTPMLRVILPFTHQDTVYASVKVTLLNEFTQNEEFAGVYLLDETGLEFGAKKERVDGKLVFSPGDVEFTGKPGQEGDPKKYVERYTPESKAAGPLRVLVDRGSAFFQVGPSADDRYLTFFQSAIRDDAKYRGFSLVAAGAPTKSAHWVRFEDFRVARR